MAGLSGGAGDSYTGDASDSSSSYDPAADPDPFGDDDFGGGDDPEPEPEPDPEPTTPAGPGLDPGANPEPEPDDPTGGGANEDTGSTSPSSGSGPVDDTNRFDDELGGDPTGSVDDRQRDADVEFSERQRSAARDLDNRFPNTDIEPEDVVIGDGTARLRDDAVDEVSAGQRGAAGDLVGDPVGRPTTDGTTAADAPGDQTTAADGESGRLEELAEQYDESVTQRAGEIGRNASPLSPVEQAVFGTDVTRTFNEAAFEGAASVGNVPGAVVGARDTVQTLDESIARGYDPVTVAGVPTGVAVPDISGRQAVATDAAATGASAAETAASNPVQTAGLVAGGAVTGIGASRVTTGVARRATRSTRSPGDFVDDTRAQSQFGRARGDSDSTSSTGGQPEVDVDMDELDDLLDDFERAERSRRVEERVEERILERNREAARRQEPSRRQGLDPENRFDPDSSTVSEGNRYDPDRSVVSERGSFDTTRSGPTQSQMDAFASRFRGSTSSSADDVTLTAQQQARAQNVPTTDLRTSFDPPAVTSGVSTTGTGTRLGRIASVNDPTNIAGAAVASGTALDSAVAGGSADAATALDAELDGVNDQTGVAPGSDEIGAIDVGSGIESGVRGDTATDTATDTGTDTLTETDTATDTDTTTRTTTSTTTTTTTGSPTPTPTGTGTPTRTPTRIFGGGGGGDGGGRFRFELTDANAADGGGASSSGGGATDEFTNPFQSLDEVDEALTDDLGGFDAP